MPIKENGLPELLRFADGSAVTGNNWEKRRQELVRILAEQVYGQMPDRPAVSWEIQKNGNGEDLGGKAEHLQANISLETPGGLFTFPLNIWLPKAVKKPPLILQISFYSQAPNRYFPLEEICDRGYGAAQLYYKDITDDNGDYSDGLAGMYPGSQGKWGKIGMWALGLMCAMDMLVAMDSIDSSRITVAGHSRLGKTALWAAANDPRFYAVHANNSGCAGAALHRRKPESAESIAAITRNFPFWFNGQFQNWIGKEADMPFDQHFLLAAVSPRRLSIANAMEDIWAHPQSEYAACTAAAQAWGMLGYATNWQPEPDFTKRTVLHNNRISWQIRPYGHYFSRYDWNCLIDFLNMQ